MLIQVNIRAVYDFCTLYPFLDIDECTNATSPCAVNANCTNLLGNFTCYCMPGYEGDGYLQCTGKPNACVCFFHNKCGLLLFFYVSILSICHLFGPFKDILSFSSVETLRLTMWPPFNSGFIYFLSQDNMAQFILVLNLIVRNIYSKWIGFSFVFIYDSPVVNWLILGYYISWTLSV